MAQPVKTQALAAYIDSRKMRFAGAPVTLRRLAQMLAISPDAIGGATVSEVTLAHIAQYLKLSSDELRTHAAAHVVADTPTMAPTQMRTLTPPGVPTLPKPLEAARSPEVPELTPRAAGSDTAIMPREQLANLVASSRRSEPVIEVPPAVGATTEASSAASDDADVTISFEDVEPTPPPVAAPDTKSDAKSGKSKKSKSKSK